MLLAALVAAAGLYPIQLPEGQRASARLTSEIASRAQYEIAAPSGCMPDEDVCLADAARRGSFSSLVSAEVKPVQNGYYVHIREFAPDRKLIREVRAQASLEEIPTLFATPKSAAVVPAAAMPESSGMTVAQARARAELGLFAGGIGLLLAAGGAELYAHVATQSSGAGPNALTASSAPRNANTLAIALAATGAGAILGGAFIVAVTPESASVQARF
jgi:hypothetical protein